MKRDILGYSRKTKRRKIVFRVVFFLILLLIIFSGAVGLFYINKFRVQNVSLKGNITIETEKISSVIFDSLKGKYFYLLPKNNIFLLSKEELKNNLLNNFTRIKNISISKNLPDAISVEIEERKSAALICMEQDCEFIDDSGFIFEKAPYFSGSVYLRFVDEREGNNLDIKRNLLSEEQFKKLMDFKNFLPGENINIAEIILKEDGIYEIHTSEGWLILINEKNEPRITYENLKIALDSQIKDSRKNLDYIDLRFGNKIFYKFK